MAIVEADSVKRPVFLDKNWPWPVIFKLLEISFGISYKGVQVLYLSNVTTSPNIFCIY